MCSGARRRQAVESAAATSRERPLAASSLSSHSTQPLPCRRRLELLVLATSQSKSPTTPNRRARAQTTTSKRTRKQAAHNRPPHSAATTILAPRQRAKLNCSVALGALTYWLRLDMVHYKKSRQSASNPHKAIPAIYFHSRTVITKLID